MSDNEQKREYVKLVSHGDNLFKGIEGVCVLQWHFRNQLKGLLSSIEDESDE